jgi:hypothetical protein
MRPFLSLSALKSRILAGLYSLALLWTIFQIGMLVSAMGPAYHPLWSDEFFYCMNAFSLFENETLKASFTYNGTGSRLLGADAHGIFYPILNWIPSLIFGWSNFNFIGLNFFLFIVPVGLLLLIKRISIFSKVVFCSIYFAYPLFLFYGFSFMQETVHIFFGTISGILLYLIYINKNERKYVIFFILFITIAGTFRPLWFFFLTALVPLASTRKQLLIFLLISFLGIGSSFFYNKFFIEPIPNYFSEVLEILSKGDFHLVLSSIYKHLKINVISYFSIQFKGFVYNSMKYIVLLSVVCFNIFTLIHKKRIFQSLALVGNLVFGLLFLLYDAFEGREIRSMSPLFYFNLVFLVIYLNSFIQFFMFLWVFCCFNFHFEKVYYWIGERNKPYQGHEAGKKETFSKLKDLIPKGKTILLDYQPWENTSDMMVLPVKNNQNHQIRYIIPYYKVKTIKPDYILARPWANLALPVLEKNGYFILYQNP